MIWNRSAREASPETGAGTMSETASRRLFLAEVIVAMPAFVCLAMVALVGGGYALFYFGSAARDIVASGFRQSDGGVMAVTAPIVAVCLAGLVGLVLFVKVSWRFFKEGRSGLRAVDRLFDRGLLCGLPPLMLILMFGSSEIGRGRATEGAIAACAAAILSLIPVLHLWLELRSSSDTDAAMNPPLRG